MREKCGKMTYAIFGMLDRISFISQHISPIHHYIRGIPNTQRVLQHQHQQMEYNFDINNESSLSQNSNNKKNISAGRHGKAAVIGGCVKSTKKNSHDFAHCKDCVISTENKIACSIKQCPRNGKGLLFKTDSKPDKTKVHVYQIPSQNKSVNVCLQRKKQAIERITALSQKYASTASTMMTTPSTYNTIASTRQKRERSGDEDEEEEKNEDIHIDIKEDERMTKKQKKDDDSFAITFDEDYSSPVRDLGQEIHLAYIELYGDSTGFVGDDKSELDRDFEMFMNESQTNRMG